ncbi:PP2C family protein-serine/threonine phosphatase [Streptomyces sp. NRRL F-5053]|uniref:PP2C family protein-serine/threonine phosphatase n=1 Tax=Streptomyces sp. NRRL F-5053 TaxID=1463854 RepID=UPI000690AEED|nr:PP2C family protein-serine/threonine phosphatase [Streptomyces sp. NRRL F-5053]
MAAEAAALATPVGPAGAVGPAGHHGYDETIGTLRRWAGRLPYLIIAVGIAAELLTPRHVTVSAPFAAAPLVAAAFLSFRGTLAVGVLTCGCLVLVVELHDTVGGYEVGGRTLTVVTVTLLALGVNYVLRRSGEQLASARVVAEAVQLAVLPAPPSHIDGLALAARYRAARADARIGGDFYAAEETSHGIRLIIGDVRGKGLGAVEAVVIVVGAFREAAEQEPTLADVAARLDRALQREGRRQLGTALFEGFTTALLVEIPVPAPAGRGEALTGQESRGGHAGEEGSGGEGSGHGGGGERVVRMVNRGHPGPLLLHRGRATLLEASEAALPLGLAELGVWPDRVDEVAFPPGAHLLLYTDGLSEARDAHGAFYEPEVRLAGRRFADPDELLDTVLADVAAHTAEANGGHGHGHGQQGGGVEAVDAADDMALLAVAHAPGGRRPHVVGNGPPVGPAGGAPSGPTGGPAGGTPDDGPRPDDGSRPEDGSGPDDGPRPGGPQGEGV